MTRCSKYSEAWNILKTTGFVKLAVLAHQQNSLKRAIKKRKYKDLRFKYEISELNKVAYLEFRATGNILEVTLVIKSNIWNI